MSSANAQNLRPLVTTHVLQALVPDEAVLFLDPPPFCTVADYIADGNDFFAQIAAPNEIDPNLALVIGDFGLGSDTAIILDYRHQPGPQVWRLQWQSEGASDERGIHWCLLTASFDEFARRLGL